MHVEGALIPIETRLYMHTCGYARTYVMPVALDSVAGPTVRRQGISDFLRGHPMQTGDL